MNDNSNNTNNDIIMHIVPQTPLQPQPALEQQNMIQQPQPVMESTSVIDNQSAMVEPIAQEVPSNNPITNIVPQAPLQPQPALEQQNMAQQVQENKADASKSKKTNIVMIAIIGIFILAAIAVTLYYINTTKEETHTPTTNPVALKMDSKSIMDNIDLKEIKTIDKYGRKVIAVKLKNNNDRVVTINSQINYYNENNEIIDSKSDNVNYFGTNQDAFLIFKTDYEYDHYKITYTAEDDKDLYPNDNDISKITATTSKNKNALLSEINNNSDSTVVGATIIALFYKQDEIVAIGDEYAFTIENDSSYTVQIPLPKVNYTKLVSFDKYETYITEVNYE